MSAAAVVSMQQVHAADVLVNADITTSETWTRNNDYILGQPIYVKNGATLTIEPGTIIRGEPESSAGANDPGALIITRGSKMFALGTKAEPIVFTNLDDDNVRMSEGTPPYDRLETALQFEGTWGGLILLGRGYIANNTLNAPNPAREFQVEGLTGAGGLGLYGDCAGAVPPIPLDECDDDDSGILNYVSLRYGGFNLSADNEINGVTWGAVGRSTDVDYVEVFQNRDDGMEFFGGTVGIKHIVVANQGDDGIDYDEGFRGKGQFILVMEGVAGSGMSDKGGEHDGGNNPDGSRPMSIPTFYNTTYIGHGQKDAAPGNTTLHIRDNAGGRFYNNFYADFDSCSVCIEGTPGTVNSSGERTVTPYVTPSGNCSATTATTCQLDTDCPGGEVCVLHYQQGASDFQLELRDNTWWCMGAGNLVPTSNAQMSGCGCDSVPGTDPGLFTDPNLENEYLSCADPLPIRALQRTSSGNPAIPDQITFLDPRPDPNSPLLDPNQTYPLPPADGFYSQVHYRGAFDANDNWAMGWTTMDRLGYFPSYVSGNSVPITGDITTSMTLHGNNEYVLTQPIYVKNGATLTIEPCTVIRGEPESTAGANDPGALIITRGSKIEAEGTEDCPIVFTNLDDDNIGMNPGTNGYDSLDTALAYEGTWGGLILLGRSYVANNTLNAPNPAREFQVEGLTAAGGLGLYGDCAGAVPPIPLDECDDDDSGLLNYVSLRYGGFNLSADNEINGVTWGAVGRSTDVDYVEVFQNRDDGMEFFGGTVGIKHIVVGNQGDDGIDYDEGFRGRGQYILVMEGVAGSGMSDKGGEHDGGNNPDGSRPMSIPTFYNTTYIGHGQKDAAPGNTTLHIRDNAGGQFYNSLYADFDSCSVCIEGTPGTVNSSGERTVTPYVTPSGNCSATTSTTCQLDTDCPGGEVCVPLYQNQPSTYQLELRNNTWWCMGAGNLVPTSNAQMSGCGCDSVPGTDPGLFTDPNLENTYVACATPYPFRELMRTSSGNPAIPDQITSLDPRPDPLSVSGAAVIDPNSLRAVPAGSDFFTPAEQRGAFNAGINWARGWTVMDRLGYFPTCSGSAPDSVPDAVRNVQLGGPFGTDPDRIEWKPPYGADGTETYDTLRSTDPSDFTGADCVETDGGDTSTVDPMSPPPGGIFYYAIRSNNSCGDGYIGENSNHVLRAATTCP